MTASLTPTQMPPGWAGAFDEAVRRQESLREQGGAGLRNTVSRGRAGVDRPAEDHRKAAAQARSEPGGGADARGPPVAALRRPEGKKSRR